MEKSINKLEESDNRYDRKSMMEEIELYCDQLGMKLPNGYPDEMSDEDMLAWIFGDCRDSHRNTYVSMA